MPLITVILPVYNIKGEYLTKAVGSVLAQSFDDFELLIVDDGSRRETAAVCDELAAEDKRITAHSSVAGTCQKPFLRFRFLVDGSRRRLVRFS